MQKVAKKKPVKGMSGKKRALLLLLCILLAAGGLYLLRCPDALPPPADKPPKEALLSRPAEEIAGVTVENAGEGFTLIRRGQGFCLAGREDMALRQDAVQAILAVCADLRAEETVLDTAETQAVLSDFSLDPPLLRFTVLYTDGRETALRLGAFAPDDIPKRYCMQEGDTRIFSVLAEDAEPFLKEKQALRAFAQPSLRADLLDRVTVTGSVTMDMHYTPSGWIMDAPYRYPLNALRVNALLDSIESMGFDAYLGSPEEADLSALGLDDPALRVTLIQGASVVTGEDQNGQTLSVDVPAMRYELAVGQSGGESALYVLWQGGVYRASRFLLGFWQEIDVDGMLLQEPVNFLVNDLNRVSIAARGKNAAYTVEMVESITQNNQIATDEYGRVLYDAEVKRDGEASPMDAEKFLSWYQRLAALKAAGMTPEGYAPAGEETCRVTIENDAMTRVVSFTPYDDLHSAMAVDGVCRFYVTNAALQAVIDGAP